MCWNAEISLSTFVFGIAVTAIALVNDMVTWKTAALYVSIAGMQLIEFGVWSYPGWNTALSKLGLALIAAQPMIAALSMRRHKERFYWAYAAWLLAYLALNPKINFATTVAPNGHLRWEWLQPTHSAFFAASWAAFLATALWYSGSGLLAVAFSTVLIAWAYVSYADQGTWGSMYCSFGNLMFLKILATAACAQYGPKYFSGV